MATQAQIDPADMSARRLIGETATWTGRITLLWLRRRFLVLAGAVALAASVILVLLIPKSYKSTARIMPPNGRTVYSSMLAHLQPVFLRLDIP